MQYVHILTHKYMDRTEHEPIKDDKTQGKKEASILYEQAVVATCSMGATQIWAHLVCPKYKIFMKDIMVN